VTGQSPEERDRIIDGWKRAAAQPMSREVRALAAQTCAGADLGITTEGTTMSTEQNLRAHIYTMTSTVHETMLEEGWDGQCAESGHEITVGDQFHQGFSGDRVLCLGCYAAAIDTVIIGLQQSLEQMREAQTACARALADERRKKWRS
jgi:hypothetical protein